MSAERATRPFVDRPVGDLERAEAAAKVAAAKLALDEPKLMRAGMNALFRSGDVVLRVGRPSVAARYGLEMIEHLRSRGISTTVPVTDRVVVHGELSVTAWRHVECIDAPVDWRAVGAMVRLVHELEVSELPARYPVPLPSTFPWWDFPVMLDELGSDIDPPALDGLTAAITRSSGWREWANSPPVVCHGDVHPGNVIMTSDGPLLIDWDLMCWATPAWDHAMLLTLADRWGGSPTAYDEFADGYGASFATDRAGLAIAELRNVAATLMRVRAARRQPAAADEAARRLRFWRGDPDAPIWRAQ